MRTYSRAEIQRQKRQLEGWKHIFGSTAHHSSENILRSLVDPYRAAYGPRGDTHPKTYILSLADAIRRGDVADIQTHCRWLNLDCEIEGKGSVVYLRRKKAPEVMRSR